MRKKKCEIKNKKSALHTLSVNGKVIIVKNHLNGRGVFLRRVLKSRVCVKPIKTQKKVFKLSKEFYFKKHKKKRFVLKTLSGLLVGFINGFWGGGGGMVCVPALTKFFLLPQKKAHATALLVILPLSLISVVVYFTSGDFRPKNLEIIATGFLLGGLIGAKVLAKINNNVLKVLFAVLVLVAGVRLLF